MNAYEGLPYPRRGQQKCGDGKPSPYGEAIIDGLGPLRGAALPSASISERSLMLVG